MGIEFSVNVLYVVSELILVTEPKFIYKQTCNSVWCPSVIEWSTPPLVCVLQLQLTSSNVGNPTSSPFPLKEVLFELIRMAANCVVSVFVAITLTESGQTTSGICSSFLR